MSDTGTTFKVWGTAQPPVERAGAEVGLRWLPYYRVMAVVTGVFLLFATIELILHYATSVSTPGYEKVWTVHGWLFFVYVLVTVRLAYVLKWPLLRLGLVLLAGTIPTMSFVAERKVTAATRKAAA